MTRKARTAVIERKTKETTVNVSLDLDGWGEVSVEAEDFFLGHFLTTLGKYASMDIHVKAQGDNEHHLIEDVAISLGQALRKAVATGPAIERIAHRIVPMDDALVMVAVDLVERPYFKADRVPMPMFEHFLRSFAHEARLCLHVQVWEGHDEHHVTEAIFKALGGALYDALTPREGEELSTKGAVRVRTG